MNRQNVIDHLQIIRTWAAVGKDPIYRGIESNSCESIEKWIDDALALLKEQEPIKPTINEYGKAYCICGENVGIIPNSKNLPKIRSKYCSECGRRMKWE